MLLACLQCRGTDRDKAEVFHRIISPRIEPFVTVTDKDLRTALRFMISIVTVFEEMTREMIRQPAMGVNFIIFQERILRYAPTIDGMMNDFLDEIFGETSHRVLKDEFIERLANLGWKYLNMSNLYELFTLAL